MAGTCKETAGILFERRCKSPAVTTCMDCKKAVCTDHMRGLAAGQAAGKLCIACSRKRLKGRQQRGSQAHLRSDPYFYWYHNDYYWDDDPYDEDDYSLFDNNAAAATAGNVAFAESGDDDGLEDAAWDGS